MSARDEFMSADLQWTRQRLQNWGRWSRTSRAVGRCFSAEWRYTPERLIGDEESDRRRAKDMIDVLDALAVWRAIMPHQGMPMSLAMVLHGHYAKRLRDQSLRAWLRRHGMTVRGRDLANLIYEAELAAHNRLLRNIACTTNDLR